MVDAVASNKLHQFRGKICDSGVDYIGDREIAIFYQRIEILVVAHSTSRSCPISEQPENSIRGLMLLGVRSLCRLD